MEPGEDTSCEPAPLRRRFLDVVPFALTVLCAGVFSFLSGGYIFARSAPAAVVYLLAAAVWVWFLRRRSRPSWLFLSALAAFGLFVAWTGLSVLWSYGPDRSWMAFDVAALYLAVLAVVGLTPAGRLQVRVAGYGFLVVCVAVAVYALLGKVLPEVVTHAHTYARLDSPIGYWNVLALMMVLGLAVVLALAGDRTAHPAWRALAAAAGVLVSLTFFFTLSRGGWVAMAVALVAYFALSTTRLSSFVSLLAIVAPSAVAVWRVRGLTTLFQSTTDDALRTAQGHVLLRWALVAVAVAVVIQLGMALVHRVVPWPRWLRVAAGAAVVVVLIAGVSVGSWRYLEPRGGMSWLKDRVSAFSSDSDTTLSGEGTTRLISMNTGRPALWREALQQSRSEGALGTGAGTFVFTHERFRETGGVVKHAHSQWFNVLSELGVVGLVLFIAAVALILAAAVRNPLADRGDPMRPLVVALQAGLVAYVVHISWDWDWDMAAVGVVFFLFAATCSSYLSARAGRQEPRDAVTLANAGAPARRRAGVWPLRAAASAALVLLAVSWFVPYLSLRAQSAAIAAAGQGRLTEALSEARRAARLDPLAVAPLLTESAVLQQQGRNREALAVLRRAQRLQPDDAEVYYREGRLLLTAFDDRKAAIAALKLALALDPHDRIARYELEQAVRR
jgi:tetratricopeptide (TPR) repeat protein